MALPNQQTVDYPSFKLVIVGDGGTGKTTFVKRHLTGEFEKKYEPTMALPNQQTVDYPSFKLVIVGDGGTGETNFMKRYLTSKFKKNYECIIGMGVHPKEDYFCQVDQVALNAIALNVDALNVDASNIWFIDSGCSRHMTGNKSFFTTLVEEDYGFVTCADGSRKSVKGRGLICIPGLPSMRDALYVDGLKVNLISVSHLAKEGHTIIFGKDGCTVLKDNGKILLKGNRSSDDCYILKYNPNNLSFEQIELWLDQMNYRANQVTINSEKNLKDYEISAKSNYNFKKPLFYLDGKLDGAPNLHFVNSPTLAPPEVQIDLAVQQQHEVELVASA